MFGLNYKKLFFFILITLLFGFIGSLFVNTNTYQNLIKPNISPPTFVFPIVWTILYLLMGISLYLVSEEYGNKIKYYLIYLIQLIVNILWPILFFKFNLFGLSFLWILLLLVLVIIMIKNFYQISRKAAYLQIPYLIWLIFASYLNFSIFLLNK